MVSEYLVQALVFTNRFSTQKQIKIIKMFISNLLAHAIGLSMAMGEILAASKAFHGLTGSDSATSYVTLIARSNVLSSQ